MLDARFYRTYEGLKQDEQEAAGTATKRFYRTYEGLKRAKI